MKNAIFMMPLSPEALTSLIMISGVLVMFGAFIPNARALAISILTLVVAYILFPVFDPYIELIPLWLLIPLFVVILLNILCEMLVFLGFRKKKKKEGWFIKDTDTESDHQRACLGKAIGLILAFPFRIFRWLMKSRH